MSKQEKIDTAVDIMGEFGQVEGDQHKAWVIDQVMRALLGKHYEGWVCSYIEAFDTDWEIGIAHDDVC